uniref:Uncharacterized protein n=1 Tax=Lepeophtheirus salmonis TaxID=72036 RepID=A0A0K2TLE0_LEPSM
MITVKEKKIHSSECQFQIHRPSKKLTRITSLYMYILKCVHAK